MAVTFDAVGPSSAGSSATNAASFTWTHTVAAGPCAVVVGVGCSTDGSTLTATCGGVSMTSLGKVHNNFSGTSGFTQLWGLANVSTGAKTILVSGGGGTDFEGGSLSYAGADTSAPFGTAVTAPVSAVGNVTAASVTVAGTTAGNLVTGVCSFGSATVAAGAGSTSRWVSNAWSSSAAGNAAGVDKAGGGSVTLNWTDTAGDWFGAVGVEVKAGAGGGGASPVGVQPQRGGRTYRRKWDRPQQWQFPSQVIIPTATVTAGLASGAGAAAVPVFGNYIVGLAGSGLSWFITNQGTPKLLIADNPWALIPNAGRWSGTYQTTIDNYCNSRAAQGYTAVYTDPLGNTVNGGAFANGNTYDNVPPFNTGTDPSSGLNNSFWTRVDYFIAACARNNMVAMLNIAYDGGAGDDISASGAALFSKTSTQYTNYGANLAARYATTPNIIWVVGNDYFGTFDTPYSNILTGLRGGGDTHLITIHNNAETTSRYDFGTGGGNAHEAWGFANAQFNGVYQYAQTYFGVEYALAEASPITTILLDGYFYTASGTNADRAMRQFFWWTLASGAVGASLGDERIWQWDSGAAAAVTVGPWYNGQSAVIRATIEPLANWQNLQAAPGSGFITAGRGTRYGGTTSGGGGAHYAEAATDNYIAASLCADKSLALIYFSAGTASSTITIDQTKLATGYTATWVDPASGAQSSGTAGATYANHGTNSAGDRDWVLVLKAPAGTSVTAGLASGTGTAQGAAPAVAVNAVAATEAGAALSPAVSVGVNAVAATEVGAALGATPAVAVTAALASGAGAALNATASTTTSGSAAATLAAAAGAALNATPAIGVNAALAAGTGAAVNPAVTTTASPLATAAAGAGTAQGATVSVAPVAAAAAGTGTARNAAAAITVTAVLAAGTGAAQGATASTVTSGTANAAPATGTGTARSPAAAIAVTAGPATGTGTAAPVTGPVTAWRLFPSASGPSAPVSYAGNFLCGVIFKVTDGAQWFGGYYKWVAPGGDTTARKFALWQVTGAGAGVLLPAATVTSGTLTAGQWNFIPLATPVKLAIGTAYNACTGWTAVHGFEDSDTAGSGTGAADSFGTGGHTAGIVTGPLTAFSDHAFSRPEPYGMAQGVFSVAGTDPAVIMPSTGSNSGNFWVDVQVSPTGPAGYPGPYRLWPGKLDTNPGTTTDAAVNYDIATEFAISQSCLLGKVWYFSPPGTAQLASAANVWSITGGGLTGTLAAQASSPSWSGAAASGWVSCTFTGVVLPPGTYKVSVYNSAAVPDNWGAKDALTDYWRAGEGGNGITWGPLSAPNLAGASLAYLYDGSMGGHTPPFTDGTTLAGQPTFTQGPPDSYPYLYAPVTSPTSGSTQNYWIDVEVTPVIPAGLASGAGAAQPPAAAAGVNAGLAAGTGTAQGATAAAAPAVTAGVASGTGAALGAVAASAASPAPPAATGTGTAQSPAAAAGVNATRAAGAGAALNATVTATASPPAAAATGTGAALNATASTAAAGTAPAGLAAGTGTAGSTTPAVGAAAAAATEAGAALGATVSTAAFTNAQAGLATGTGAALNPGLTLTSNATPALATGTGATGSVPAVGVNATTATGAGTGRNAVGQAGWVAPAGLAAGTGTAQSPAAVLVSLAQAAAATALGAALRATAKTVDPFTVGTLTTATTATGVLTAATAAGGGGTLTASDTRTGGPT